MLPFATNTDKAVSAVPDTGHVLPKVGVETAKQTAATAAFSVVTAAAPSTVADADGVAVTPPPARPRGAIPLD